MACRAFTSRLFQELAHLPLVRLDGRQIRLDLHPGPDRGPPQSQLHRVVEEPGDPEELQGGGAAGGEGEELPGEIAGAGQGRERHVELRLGRTASLDVGAGELHLPEDGREQVVEVVGDPPGHEPQRLQPLRLAQLLQHPLPLGDVHQRDQHRRSPQVLDLAGRLLHRPRHARRRDPVHDGPARARHGCPGFDRRRADRGQILGMDELSEPLGRLALDLAGLPPDQVGQHRIRVGDLPVLHDDDPGQRPLGDLPELGLGLVTGGDIVEDADRARGGARRGRIAGEGDLGPEDRAVLAEPPPLQGADVHLPGPDLPDHLCVRRPVLGVDDLRAAHAGELVFPEPGDLAVALVHSQEAILGVDGEDADRGPFEGLAPAGLALPQRRGEIEGALPGPPVPHRHGGEPGEQEGHERHEPELDGGGPLPDPGHVGIPRGEPQRPGHLVHRQGGGEGEPRRRGAPGLVVVEQLLRIRSPSRRRSPAGTPAGRRRGAGP